MARLLHPSDWLLRALAVINMGCDKFRPTNRARLGELMNQEIWWIPFDTGKNKTR